MNFRCRVRPTFLWLTLLFTLLTGGEACAWAQAVTANSTQQLVFAGLRSVAAKGQINALGTDAAGDVYLAFDQGDGVRVLKVANDGGALLAQVQLGAAGDSAVALAVDASGNIYIAGTSTSGSLAATSGAAIGNATAGTTNSFVAKFDGELNEVFLTFTGGTRIAASAVAASGDSVFVTGITYGSDLPVSATAIEPAPAFGSFQNGFVEAFSGDGTTLRYATYISGAQGDTTPTGIAVDAGDDAWLVGSTTAPGFPTIAAVVPEILSTPSGFLLQLTPAGDGIVYSTFVPGAGLSAVALDSTGLNLLVSGQVALGQFPVDTVTSPLVPTPYQVLLRMSLDGSTVLSGTVIAPGLQSTVAAASGGAGWIGGSFNPGAAPLLPQNALATIGTGYAVRVTPGVGVDETVRMGGLANFNQTYASVPVSISGLAVDSSGAFFAGGSAQPTASASLLATQTYDFPLRGAPTPALPSFIENAEIAAASCEGSLCSGSGGYLSKIDVTDGGAALAFSIDGLPLVTLRNLGSASANNLLLTTSAGTLTTDCGTDLAAGAECNVLLTGGAAGILSATASNGGGASVAFHAYSEAAPLGGLAFAPKELDFGIQTAGSAASLRTILVTNLGSAAATFSEGIAGTPKSSTPFSEASSTCPLATGSTQKVLATGASCTITVAFTALSGASNDGFVEGEWTVGLGDVLLTGYSQTPSLSVSAGEVDFGTQFQGGLVLPRYLYLSNASDSIQSHTPVSVVANSPFTVTDECPDSLAPMSVCRLRIDYASSIAPSADSLSVPLDGGLSVLLTGQTMPAQSVGGSTVASSLTVSPTAATFGNGVVVSGVSAVTQTVTITNDGTSTVALSIAVNGDFSEVSSCGSSLMAGAACAVVITFTPSQPGTRQGLLTVSSGAGTAPLTVPLSGTGNGILDANNSTLSFGATPVGQPLVQYYKVTQAFQSLTLKSSGPYLVTLIEDGGFGYGNPPASSYVSSGAGPCHNCWIGIRFQPTSSGEQSGTLSISSDPSGIPYVLQLTGSGIATTGLVLSPTVIDFGTIPVNSVSGTMVVNLTNLDPSGAPIEVSSVTASGDFAVSASSGTCAGSLAHTASCPIWVQFGPSATGGRTGSLDVETSDGIASASLLGTGTEAAALAISPLSLTFALLANGSGKSQNVLVQNSGPTALTIARPTTSTANFAVATDCGILAPGANCSIGVSFTPGSAPSMDVLTIPVISQGSGNSPQVQQFRVALSGTYSSTSEELALSTATLAFGPVATDTLGSSRQITVTNLSAKQVAVSEIIPRDYELQANLCSTLAPGASCTLSIVFIPQENGDLPGTLAVTTAALDGSESNTTLIDADGFGVGTGSLTITGGLIVDGVFNFGTVAAGETASQKFQLTNSGMQALSVRRVVSQPPFLSTTTCGGLVLPSATCSVTVTYSPQATLSASDLGSLTIESDAESSPNILNLEGQPASAASGASASPLASFSISQGSLSFAATTVGDTSTSQTLVLTNTGNLPLQVGAVSTTAEFTVESGCGLVAAGASCNLMVTSSPQAAGDRLASLEIASNAADSLEYVTLVGVGLSSPLVFSPASLVFGGILIGSSATLPVQITNSSASAVAFASITSGGEFSVTGNCPSGGAPLPPSASCTEQVTFQPTAAGPQSGSLSLTTSASTEPLKLSLSGIGLQPELIVTPSSLAFGAVRVGASASLTVKLENGGTVPITSLTLSVTGDYAVTVPCAAASLAVGASCTAQVTFTPIAGGTRAGALTIMSSDPSSPLTVPLTGTGATNSGFLFTVNGGATATATVVSGNYATFALLVTPFGNFGGSVALTCTPQQPVAYASCSLLQSQVVVGSSPVGSTATLNTEESSAGVGSLKILPQTGAGRAFLALLLPGVLLMFRRGRNIRRWVGQGLALAGLLFVLLLSGCGGHGGGGSGSGPVEFYTPPGQYQFQVTANATSGVAFTQTVVLNLVVTAR